MKHLPVITVLLFLSFLNVSAQVVNGRQMIAHFINVGQADATLLEFPCGAVLIDAGAQGNAQEQALVDYLSNFFSRRVDLNRTIDLVIVTHAHLDHNLALDNIVQHFTVRRYIDNGLKAGSGRKNQNWLQANARKLGITYASYSFEEITANGNFEGMTDEVIDPLECGEVDPQIVLLSGRFKRKPAGWSKTNYENNGNNHSIVIKVSFGDASFLFTGDLEEEAIHTVLNQYSNTSAFDVDILRVGHHGSHNATTSEFLEAVTPTHAIISCGKWTFGRTGGQFTTFSYGHPRIVVLDLLASVIEETRSTAITIKAAVKSKQFKNYLVEQRIYATPWDGTVQIDATAAGTYRVTRNH